MTSICANTNVCLKAYVKPFSTPIIASVTAVTPGSGLLSSDVTLTGSGLGDATAVAFQGAEATSFTVDSDTQITATVPVGAITGPITVTTPAGSAESAVSFTVLSVPNITSFAPSFALAGASVTLTGSGFAGTTAVSFGSLAASFVVDSSTQITATVPLGAGSAPISVSNPAGSTQSATSFIVTVPSTITLKLSGPSGGAIKLGRRLTAKGTVSPSSLAGGTLELTLQRKRSGTWINLKHAPCVIGAGGTYSWRYTPTSRGSYRLCASVAGSATNTAAQTSWRAFKVT